MFHRTVLRNVFAFAVMLLLSATAQAQLFRTYLALAPAGNDSNACTLLAPCRLLPVALAAVADGGEIWMLDSANYNTGPVNITKSVTILAVPGAVGSLVAAGGNAINIATAGVKVALRNLVIVPQMGAGGTNGIVMTAGTGLTVDNCLIANMPGTGINVSTAASVRIVNTIVRDNSSGIILQGGARADIADSKFLGAATDNILVGGSAAGSTTASISNSVVTGGANGIDAFANSAATIAHVSVIRSTISNNTFGVGAESNNSGTASLTISESLVTGNLTGLFQGVGTGTAVLQSLGNNTVRKNGTDTSGTISPVALQ